MDAQWKDHLLTLDHLKEGIGLRGYGQKDPLVEFKREAFALFEDLMDRIDTESVRFLFLVRPAERPPQPQVQAAAAPSSTPGFVSSSGLPPCGCAPHQRRHCVRRCGYLARRGS